MSFDPGTRPQAWSIKALSEHIGACPEASWDTAVEWLKSDTRKGAVRLRAQLMRKISARETEHRRLEQMYIYERDASDRGYMAIAGIDEAGRGPLVGSVVSAAVILNPEVDWSGVDDSKKLSEAKRNGLYDHIMKHARAVGVGVSDHLEIDEMGILEATRLSMKRALEALPVSADFLLIDAVRLDDIPIEQHALIKGDAKSVSIAAASIVAKVTRDRMLYALHERHPEYGFDRHKGYGTDAHYAAIRRYGVLPEHRRRFLKGII